MYGITFPFKIVNGSVASSNRDADVVQSRIMFCMGSQVNERVMRPSWGIDVLATVYSLSADLETGVQEAISNAFRTHFPKYTFKGVTIERDPDYPGSVSALVHYGDVDASVGEAVNVQLSIPSLSGD